MVIVRTNDQSGLGIDENVNDVAVAAQEAHLINKFLAPTAKLNSDGFRLRPASRAPHRTKRLKKPMGENFFPRLGRRETDAVGLWFGPGGNA